MRISEIFYSIQGEGTNTGKPAIFLRLSGCHLRCEWCDSKFTWDLTSGKEMDIKKILKEIKKFPCKHLVITGGEPLIQQHALKELLTKIPEYFIEMETSGSLKSELDQFINQYNCSPKLKHAKVKNFQLKDLPVEKTFYKFVAQKPNDIKEIKTFIKKHKLAKDHIILMPEGTKKSELNKKLIWLAEICKKENFILSSRLHIEIWGNKKGV